MAPRLLSLALIAVSGAAWAGSLDKYDKQKPAVRYVSSAAIGDIERCLMTWHKGLMNPPTPDAIRQPDRPGQVTLLWKGALGGYGRVDLKEVAGGTEFSGWGIGKLTRSCAPAA